MRAQRIGRVLKKYAESKQILKDAKQVIGEVEERLGKKGEFWVKEALVEGNKFCLLGAIRDVWVEDDVQRIAFTAIKASIPGFETSTELRLFNFSAYDDEVATWNDDANREFKSIKEVLKRAKKAINWAIVGEKR